MRIAARAGTRAMAGAYGLSQRVAPDADAEVAGRGILVAAITLPVLTIVVLAVASPPVPLPVEAVPLA